MAAGAELLTGPRGSDVRLDNLHRPTREEKRTDYAQRRAAKTAARDLLQAERKAGHWATAATATDGDMPADPYLDAASNAEAGTKADDETDQGV
jgi:GTP-binding protein